MRFDWRWLVLVAVVALGVDRCAALRGAEQLGRLKAEAKAAQAVADSSALRALRAELEAARLRAAQDSVVAATDSLRRRAAATTLELSNRAEAALRVARDSSATVGQLRVVVVGLVDQIRADSIAIRNGRQALVDANMAHARKVAELQARIPSRFGQTLEKVAWLGAGAGACALFDC